MLGILLSCKLIVFSQVDTIKTDLYPKTYIVENDTFTVFKFSQTKEIAKDLVTKDYLEDYTILLNKEIDILKKQLNNSILQNKNLQEQIVDKDNINLLNESTIDNLNKINLQLEKKIKQKKTINKIVYPILTGVAGSLIIISVVK